MRLHSPHGTSFGMNSEVSPLIVTAELFCDARRPSSMSNWENPKARRVGQPKTVWFSPGMTFCYKTRPTLGGRDRVSFNRQHTRILVDGNS